MPEARLARNNPNTSKSEKHTSNRTLIGKTQYKDNRTIFKLHFMTRGTEKKFEIGTFHADYMKPKSLFKGSSI